MSLLDPRELRLERLVTRGPLNGPWGAAIAPPDFGPFGGKLLVANMGNGQIHAFDLDTGELAGALTDLNGEIIQIPNLRGLHFGNGQAGGDTSTLYFTASPAGEGTGVLGKLTFVPTAD